MADYLPKTKTCKQILALCKTHFLGVPVLDDGANYVVFLGKEMFVVEKCGGEAALMTVIALIQSWHQMKNN